MFCVYFKFQCKLQYDVNWNKHSIFEPLLNLESGPLGNIDSGVILGLIAFIAPAGEVDSEPISTFGTKT